MDEKELMRCFAGRGNIELAFNEAFNALNVSISALTNEEKLLVFGSSAYKWYSIEIIHSAIMNTIKYDGNHIVFHRWPVFERSMVGKVMRANNENGIQVLITALYRMQNALNEKKIDFTVHEPAIIQLNKKNNSIIGEALYDINFEMNSYQMSDASTLYDFIRAAAHVTMRGMNNVPDPVKDVLAIKLAGCTGALHANEIKKLFPKNSREMVAKMMREREHYQEIYLFNIEHAVYDATIHAFEKIPSLLVNDTKAEIARLKSSVTMAWSEIHMLNDEKKKTIVNDKLRLMKDLHHITSPIEGIVFTYRGNMYKLTGWFRYAHQIISMLKY
jgi:hypothetical protein